VAFTLTHFGWQQTKILVLLEQTKQLIHTISCPNQIIMKTLTEVKVIQDISLES
jgi:hypothetical protein